MILQSAASTISIVEDDPEVRSIASEYLSDHGLSILEASCASDALCALDSHLDIALLFTDVNMPGSMDGLALATRVHALRPAITLIITSGRDMTNRRIPDHAIFLSKPYRLKEMADLIICSLTPGRRT